MQNKNYDVKEKTELLKFMYDNFEGMSKNKIKTLLKTENIQVNGNLEKQFDLELKKGDIVTLLPKKIQDRVSNIEILYEDKDFFVINKPYGLLTVVAEDVTEKTAFKIATEHAKKNSSGRLHVVHRLDKETSGVLIFTKSGKLKQALQDDWNNYVTKRGYLAIVEGCPKVREDKIISNLAETKTKVMYSTNKTENSKEAITNYKVVKTNKNYSLLEVDIETGRKNQIRVHLMEMGNAIVGDKKYNANSNPIKRLGLHANSLEIFNPLNKKKYYFEAPMPKEFKKILK